MPSNRITMEHKLLEISNRPVSAHRPTHNRKIISGEKKRFLRQKNSLFFGK